MNLQWKYIPFNQLSLQALYRILALRSAIFVVEQDCPYQDLDGVDQTAEHLQAYDGDVLVGYLRIFIKDNETVIGRIVTASSHRGVGLGTLLMEKALDIVKDDQYPKVIYLMAQQHLERFYGGFGFETHSDPYDEDGIPHIDMRLTITN
jgi:ElaA protein